MREIILDTETTGLSPTKGDRLIEIGCIEIFNRRPTGREFHAFINPERDVPLEAQAIHGITTEQLRGKPLFASVAKSFLDFIGNDTLVIHNASFDVGFLNFELERAGFKTIAFDRVVDTLQLARRKHPAGPNTLDALCKRYGVDTSSRTKHGAIVDSLLLAEIYLDLLGERQVGLALDSVAAGKTARTTGRDGAAKPRPEPLPSPLTKADVAAHRAFIAALGANAIWSKYWPRSGD